MRQQCLGEFRAHLQRCQALSRRMRNLAVCLSSAGALCAAFLHGYGQGVDDTCEGEGVRRYMTPEQWAPGCGREAREVGAGKVGGK
jgi:hypothetical protein